MSSPSPTPATPPKEADRSSILAAVERRSAPQTYISAGPSTPGSTYTSFDKDHEKRQEFRRLVDPGITRPNSQEVALAALKTLFQLAENILEHPRELKYQRFKPTNTTVKARIIEPRGTLEYAIALGFRPEVERFQPSYVWHAKYLPDLRIGVAVLKEALEREIVKEERLKRTREEEKAAAEERLEKVKRAFLDDRKSRMLTDEIERQKREAIAASGPSHTPEPESRPYIPPTGGNLLTGGPEEAVPGTIELDDD